MDTTTFARTDPSGWTALLGALAHTEPRCALAIAGDTNAPPALLERLLEVPRLRRGVPPRSLPRRDQVAEYLERYRLQEALAKNPSASPALLRALLGDCPGAVLNNPALPLLLLEDPCFFVGLPTSAARRSGGVRELCARSSRTERSGCEASARKPLAGKPG